MIFRRLLWGFAVSMATSLPFFALIELKIVGDSQTPVLILSAVSVLLFYFFSALIMRMHLQSLDNLHDYFFSELLTFVCLFIVSELLVFGFAGNTYRAVCMPGCFLEMLGTPRSIACAVVFALYFILIFVFPIERKIEYLSIKDELEEKSDDDEEYFED